MTDKTTSPESYANNINNKNWYFELNSGEIRLWIEQGSSIQIKAATRTNDPVEISADEAIEIAKALNRLANQI